MSTDPPPRRSPKKALGDALKRISANLGTSGYPAKEGQLEELKAIEKWLDLEHRYALLALRPWIITTSIIFLGLMVACSFVRERQAQFSAQIVSQFVSMRVEGTIQIDIRASTPRIGGFRLALEGHDTMDSVSESPADALSKPGRSIVVQELFLPHAAELSLHLDRQSSRLQMHIECQSEQHCKGGSIQLIEEQPNRLTTSVSPMAQPRPLRLFIVGSTADLTLFVAGLDQTRLMGNFNTTEVSFLDVVIPSDVDGEASIDWRGVEGGEVRLTQTLQTVPLHPGEWIAVEGGSLRVPDIWISAKGFTTALRGQATRLDVGELGLIRNLKPSLMELASTQLRAPISVIWAVLGALSLAVGGLAGMYWGRR